MSMRTFSRSSYNLRHLSESNDDEGIKRPNRQKSLHLWRSTSLINLVGNSNKNKSPVYESTPVTKSLNKYGSLNSLSSLHSNKEKKPIWTLKELQGFWNDWDTLVNIVLVAAKGLPPSASDGTVHELFCKIRLGSETFKSKPVPRSGHPEWRERFKLHLCRDHLLKISLWDKGRHKIFMGSCVIDLSALEKERTHEIWKELDDGYGHIHLSLTMCIVRFSPDQYSIDSVQNEVSDIDLSIDRSLVGSMNVKMIKVKGLGGKSSAYCTLELDNERIQTHTARSSLEPTWNKNYVFNVYDVTSVLKLKVHSSPLTDTLLSEFRGQVSIPLLKIRDGETRWYALKDRNNRGIARGKSPRILLHISIKWDPVKAVIKLFRPKEVKHIEKPYRLDIPLLFKKIVVLANIFNTLLSVNEHFKSLFEWDNRELSACSLLVWLIICYHLKPWMIPFILLVIFVFFWFYTRVKDGNIFNDIATNRNSEIGSTENQKDTKGLSYKINDMQGTIMTVSHVLDIVVTLVEKIKILLFFRVPFLSYVFMLLLGVVSATLYFMSFNYLLMLFGIYKFMRKYLNPGRILNNDLLDFVSRIPNNSELKDWEELNVPEPNQ